MRLAKPLRIRMEKNIVKDIRKEEQTIFHHFLYLKKHYQAIFAFIIAAGGIFVWRGVWNLIDLFWFRDDLLFSNVTGIVFGIFLLYLSHRVMKQLVTGD